MPKSTLLRTILPGRRSLVLMAFFSASVLSAQFRDAIHSIRVHGEIESNGRTLNFSQVTKGQNHIRASILAPDGSVSVTVFFNQDKIYLEEDLPDNKSVRELSGEDAAAYLLDLLALNPAYHFRPNNGFNLRHPIFEGFSLEIKRVEASDPSDQDESSEQIRPIEQLRLIDLSVERDPILRTIRYLENFPEGKHGQTPRKIAFTDNSTGEGGTITLKDYNYNVGLPYFLFKPEGISSDSYK